jgi:hypothetical protein
MLLNYYYRDGLDPNQAMIPERRDNHEDHRIHTLHHWVWARGYSISADRRHPVRPTTVIRAACLQTAHELHKRATHVHL